MIQERTDTLDFIKIKKNFSGKHTVKQFKGLWKIITEHIFDKVLVGKI